MDAKSLSIVGVFKVAGDFMEDLPDIEKAVPVVSGILADIRSGKMPVLSADEMALATKLESDVVQLIADVKAL